MAVRVSFFLPCGSNSIVGKFDEHVYRFQCPHSFAMHIEGPNIPFLGQFPAGIPNHQYYPEYLRHTCQYKSERP